MVKTNVKYKVKVLPWSAKESALDFNPAQEGYAIVKNSMGYSIASRPLHGNKLFDTPDGKDNYELFFVYLTTNYQEINKNNFYLHFGVALAKASRDMEARNSRETLHEKVIASSNPELPGVGLLPVGFIEYILYHLNNGSKVLTFVNKSDGTFEFEITETVLEYATQHDWVREL